jgi:hypothetical protein
MTKPKPPGAPRSKHDPKGSFYSEEKAKMICEMIIEGKTLREISLLDGMPHRVTVFQWLHKIPEFAKMYDHARMVQADHMDDLIVQCAQEATRTNFQAMRVKIQAYQWRAARLNPARYSDTQRMQHSGSVTINRDPEDDKTLWPGGLRKSNDNSDS